MAYTWVAFCCWRVCSLHFWGSLVVLCSSPPLLPSGILCCPSHPFSVVVQVISVGGRTGRRGTGPVLAEDVHAAVTLRCVAPTSAVSGTGANAQSNYPTAAYTPAPGRQFQSGASSGFPTLRTGHSQQQQHTADKHHEKSRSAPPLQQVENQRMKSGYGVTV